MLTGTDREKESQSLLSLAKGPEKEHPRKRENS